MNKSFFCLPLFFVSHSKEKSAAKVIKSTVKKHPVFPTVPAHTYVAVNSIGKNFPDDFYLLHLCPAYRDRKQSRCDNKETLLTVHAHLCVWLSYCLLSSCTSTTPVPRSGPTDCLLIYSNSNIIQWLTYFSGTRQFIIENIGENRTHR
jgi:hypothetical protein